MYNKNLSPRMEEILKSWQYHCKSDIKGNILIFLSKIFFNIHRLPITQFKDRNLSKVNEKDLLKFFNTNSFEFSSTYFNSELNKLLVEFENMYHDTQQRLKEKFGDVEYIELSRRIIRKFNIEDRNIYNCDHPSKLYSYIYNQKENKKDCEIYMDILNDWAEYPSSTYGVIKLKKNIPIKDIIYFNHHNDYSGPLESDNYLVINKSLTGGVIYSYNDIQCDDDFLQQFLKLAPEQIRRNGSNYPQNNIFDGRYIH